MKNIQDIIDFADINKLYPDLRVVEGAAEPKVIVDGKDVIMFSSNNYLGLATHPRLINAGIEAIKKYGVGSDGSRLLSGNIQIHQDLEKEIIKFKGAENADAIIWPSGYSANVGAITAIMNPIKTGVGSLLKNKGIILSDELNHASIIDGAIMSKQKKIVYKHCNMVDLEKKLKKYKNKRKLVVTDGVFSMDGDIAPLDKISKLCKKYNAISMIDEAHSSGILGKNGHGTMEHFNLKPVEDIDILLGTFSKALASTGGFVIANKMMVKYLRIASRSYMFSTAMTPAASASIIEALKVIEEEPQWRHKLWENREYLVDGLHRRGFNTLSSETQIVPILIGLDEKAIQFSRMLFEKGIFAPCVRWPAVEKGKGRIRITLMATHTTKQIDKLLSACEKIKKELNI